MEIQVVINPDGKTCTTLNPLGAIRPNGSRYWNQIAYDEAESKRKTYDIEYKCCLGIAPHIDNCGLCADWKIYNTGSIHTAEIINGKAVIK